MVRNMHPEELRSKMDADERAEAQVSGRGTPCNDSDLKEMTRSGIHKTESA